MKPCHLLTLCAALLALCPTLATAQTSAVPGFISYQGRVVDASGANVGVGTPVNRTVIFRIWDSPSSTNTANLIYSESQTVTVSEGEFSVLVGQGVANPTQTFGYSETAKKLADIGSAFGGSARYLGVTVASAATIALTDNEITPRQQIVSTAFSMRAKYAEQVGSNGTAALTALDSGRVGIGTLAPPALFTVSGANQSTTTSTPQLLVTADDITERLRIGVDSSGTGTGFIQSFKEGTGAQNLLLNPNGGSVGIGGAASSNIALAVTGSITATTSIGIGTTTPGFPLSMANALGDKISLYGASGAHFGFGIQNNQFQIHTDTNAADVVFGYGTSAAMTETMRIKGDGKVGIGKSAPGSNLDVQGFTSYRGNPYTIASFAANATLAPLNITQGNSGLNPAISVGKNSDGNFDSLAFMTKDIERIKITADGLVGIGTATPGFPLNMSNAFGDKIALWGNSGNSSGFGIQNNLLQIHTDASAGDVAFGYGSSAAMTETMRIKGNGNVGIGTSSPGTKLQIDDGAYDGAKYGSLQINRPATGHTAAHMSFVRVGVTATGLGYGQSSSTFGFGPATVGAFTPSWLGFTSTGNVQIGTSTLSAARLNVGSVSASVYINGYLDTNGGQTGDSTTTRNLSIQADGVIVSPFVAVNSDLRIKTNLRPSDSGKDLKTLMGIEVTDYQLKDKVAHGKGTQKKVIAQQVETIYPQAVLQTTGVVPDLYKKAAVKNGWVELVTDLKKGDRVKLIGKTDQSVHEVLEIRDGAFRPDGKMNDEEVFVYGREVSDFRTVDYDAIAMLNVSATQQLKHEKDAEIQALREENAALRRELAAKDESVETRLIALERRMSGEGEAKTVSLKTAKTEQ